MEPAIVIVVTTVGLAILTKIIQRKTTDKKKLAELQKQVKDDQKKLWDLSKEAEKNQKEIATLQAGVMKQQTDLMHQNMKMSMFTMPAFLIVFWFLSVLYQGHNLVSFFPLPKFLNFVWFDPLTWIPTGWSIDTGFYKMYLIYYFLAAIVVGQIEKVYDMMKEKK